MTLNKRRETRDLWIIILLTLSLTAYHLSASLVERIRVYSEPYTNMPIASVITNVLFFWILALLWVGYRRWRRVVARERELTAILSSTGPEVVMVVDPERQILMCNEAIERTFGYSVSEVIHQKTGLLYEDRRLDKYRPHEIYDALERVGFHIGEAAGKRKNGDQVPLEIITADLRGREGAVVMVHDITERKTTEERLRQAIEDAQEAERSKDKLITELDENYRRLQELENLRDNLTHMIVHDMKTPLQALSLNVDLLEMTASSKLSEKERVALSSLYGHIKKLDVLTRSVLDMSRLEEGQMPLEIRPYDIHISVDESLAALAALTVQHQLIFKRRPDLPDLQYDHDIIQRVLVNLLLNAIQHSPAGADVRIDVEDDGAGIKVLITDMGAGVPEKFRESIFEKYGQAPSAQGTGRKSTGLGLAFCKLAIEAHGGQIGVDCADNTGSTFWFTLPKSE